MRQYNAIKQEYPGTILLFRVGDFYETFGADAIEVSKVLGIVLTKRANGSASHIELAGFPHHSLDTYLPKLVRAGKRVAVCDQLEDPKYAKGIVKRGVTELVTPGVAFNDSILEGHKDNYLASVYFPNKREAGVAFIEVSTGDFFCFSDNFKRIEKVLQTLNPSEIIVSKKDIRHFKEQFGDKYFLTRVDEWAFQYDYAREKLLDMFQTSSLKGFGIEEEEYGTVAAGGIVHYLEVNKQTDLGHINSIRKFNDSVYVWLDQFTARNLELIHPLHPDGKSFVEIIDHSQTSMGARALRRAILFPLKDIQQIQKRLDIVEAFLDNYTILEALCELFQKLGDLERLVSKIATGKLNPKEAGLLRDSLNLLHPIQECLREFQSDLLSKQAARFEDVTACLDLLNFYLMAEITGSLKDGGIIREKVSKELDEYRTIKKDGKGSLVKIRDREVGKTDISSLKIGFNKVFGYYLEVTHAHKNKVPKEWIRKQTLTNSERYITEELKEHEEKILNAEDRILKLETELYEEFIQKLQHYIHTIQRNARLIAELDVLVAFAVASHKNGYVKPTIDSSHVLDIRDGRHPVIEQSMPQGESYIPNDVQLDNEHQQVVIVTGPNMAGKSALLRQTALIVLMAQMGCYVPAKQARIGIVDKVFTRVGASDNISSGESTFMVEMNETAQIVNNATSKSLILLDEIGRGTSTYDGVSIAWALVEYLHENKGCQAKTLFATHYHELNELESRFKRVKNYNVSVKEVNGKILFLRKLKKGGSEHSFGINVAEMAGMPPSLVSRAKELLAHFEKSRVRDKKTAKAVRFSNRQKIQLNMFELKDTDTLKVRQILSGVDIDRITPVEALLKLQELKQALLK